jgi:hypothetical protein
MRRKEYEQERSRKVRIMSEMGSRIARSMSERVNKKKGL